MLAIFSKKFKKISFVLTVLILCSASVTAGSIDITSDTGIVILTIKNRPPVITTISISPNDAFQDTVLKCTALINDENPNEVNLIYKWRINDVLVELNNNYLTEFKENDLVSCEVTPIDNEGIFGESKSVSVSVNNKSAISKVAGFVIKNYNVNLSAIFNFLL